MAGWRAKPDDLSSMAQVPQSDAALRDAPLAGTWDALGRSGVTLLDPAPYFCQDAICNAVHEQTGQYFDNNHLTNSAARRIAPLFAPFWTAP